MTVSPTSDTIGEPVTITGTGFAADQQVTITFDNNPVVTSPALVTINQTGSFTAKFYVPSSTANVYTIEASAGIHKSGTTFAVVSSGQINRALGYIGSEVTFFGTGFISGRIAVIYYDDMPVAEATIDADGNLLANFRVPISSGGEHIISATDGINSAEYLFTVIMAPSGQINRILGHAGSEVIFSGARFVPDRIVVISYDDMVVAEVVVDANGNCSAKFKVPASSGGEHIVSATDGINTTECLFTMETTAPPVPVPLVPANAGKAKQEALFAWKGVTDPSGVTYTLQIASESSFASDNATSPMLLNRSRLTAAEYILAPEEKLEPEEKETPYYWRVRAVDNAFNAGDWSPVQKFYIDTPPTGNDPTDQEPYVGIFSVPMSPLFSYCLFAEVALFFCFLGYWLVKRRA